jgi:hypothetical protein
MFAFGIYIFVFEDMNTRMPIVTVLAAARCFGCEYHDISCFRVVKLYAVNIAVMIFIVTLESWMKVIGYLISTFHRFRLIFLHVCCLFVRFVLLTDNIIVLILNYMHME